MTDEILSAIDAELSRLQQARNILAASLPPSKASTQASKRAPRSPLSAEARKAIGDAQRKRWANVRTQKEAPAAPAVP